MKETNELDEYEMIIHGDCLIEMAKMDVNSIDFIVTDPPYGLRFMGKHWDYGIPGNEFWSEALRICKPGSMLAAFGGTRKHHRLMCAIEDAGWEIRDCMMWLYGSGFPKSHNNFGFEGYGTALKPAWEPIILAMKPLDGTFAQNAEKWGVAGINIDESRIESEEGPLINSDRLEGNNTYGKNLSGSFQIGTTILGRWHANLILDEEAAAELDRQSGISASRFFYCAKASSKERNEGLKGMPLKQKGAKDGEKVCNTKKGPTNALRPDNSTKSENFHPTVKPLALMKYIIKLLAPPGNPVLLDPFAGSGSTLIAAKQLGVKAIGIELEKEYCEIAVKRLEGYL
jgi:site-specific DNA-methyltransferase (adenine-specific)